jgi:hypothetical protein
LIRPISLLALALCLHAQSSVAADAPACKETELLLVPKLSALAPRIAELMGSERAGREGIAEKGQEFNVTDLLHESLPVRRFAIAGASERCALVALERGGYGRAMELWSFVKSRDGWQGKKLAASTPLETMPRTVSELVQAAAIDAEHSAEEREQLVQKFLGAFNEHDSEAMMRMMAPDIAWFNIDGDKIAPEGSSREEVGASMRRYFKSCPSCRSTLESIISTPSRVSAFEVAAWEKGGVAKEQRSLSVYEFAGSLIKRVYYFPAEKPSVP